MPASSTTGDIIWRWTDPKTVELSNVNPEPPLPTDTDTVAQTPDQMSGISMPDKEREAFMAMMGAYQSPAERARNASPEEKKAWRKQLHRFLKNERTSDPMEFDREQGIQELLDSGAMWYDEDGAYTSVRIPGRKNRDALVSAADAWADKVGLWDSQGNFNPNAPEEYINRLKQMETGYYVGSGGQ